jgi:molybdopterin biosynthesis enzyme
MSNSNSLGFWEAGCPISSAVILNDVVLNQVLVSFGGDETTTRIVDAPAARNWTCVFFPD